MTAALILLCTTLSVSDGDSIYCDGELMRILGDGVPHISGVDTPELRRYKCDREAAAAKLARDRMRILLDTPGVQIEDSGERDYTQTRRRLVRVWVPNEAGVRTAGAILLDEGHALPWQPGKKVDWCG
jgi:endonuclease YncB( thermonuclease family)